MTPLASSGVAENSRDTNSIDQIERANDTPNEHDIIPSSQTLPGSHQQLAGSKSSNKVTGDALSTASCIRAPPVMKRKGRPKGHELTTIGLPAKKAKKLTTGKPCTFSKMHCSRKEQGTLVVPIMNY